MLCGARSSSNMGDLDLFSKVKFGYHLDTNNESDEDPCQNARLMTLTQFPRAGIQVPAAGYGGLRVCCLCFHRSDDITGSEARTCVESRRNAGCLCHIGPCRGAMYI